MNIFWIFLATTIYGIVHSLLASIPVKTRFEQIFGPRLNRFYRLFYNLIGAISLLPLLLLLKILPANELYRIPFPWLMISLLIQAAAGIGLLIGVWQTGAFSFLGLRQVLNPDPPDKGSLVTHGLYRWMRHPLYTLGLVLLWLTPIMTDNLLSLNIGLTLYILVGMTLEERRLIREFGSEYLAYRRTTPALIPGIRLPYFDRN